MQTVRQDPRADAFNQDPYPFYETLRPLGDLVFWEDYGLPVAASHNVVGPLLKDRRFGREMPSDLRAPVPDHLTAFYDIEAHSMLELDPPRHTRLRGLVLRAFTSRRIAGLGPEIAALCHELIDAFPQGSFDLLKAYAIPLPVRIIARLLGVPEEMAPQLLRWSNAMVAMYQATRSHEVELAAAQASRDFATFLRDYVDEKRKRPADDLLSHLIAAEEDGAKLSTDELITTCILLLNAGHEATVHTIGNGVKACLETGARPDADPAPLTEEILRHDPPLHMFMRIAREDVTIFGHDVKRGDQVGLLLAAAGRDGAVFDQPAVFDPTRQAKAHLAFGGGLHFCVGAPLARLELNIALQTLFACCPDLSLDQPPRYACSYHFHGLDQLTVRL